MTKLEDETQTTVIVPVTLKMTVDIRAWANEYRDVEPTAEAVAQDVRNTWKGIDSPGDLCAAWDGLVKTIDIDVPDGSPLVEVVVFRDPDGDTGLSYYRDSEPVSASVLGIREVHIDPGRSGAGKSWQCSMLEEADSLSDAAAAHVRELVDSCGTDEGTEDGDV